MDSLEIKNLIKKQKINHSLDQEFYINDDIFDLEKLVEIFEVQDIQKAGAVFDIERLKVLPTIPRFFSKTFVY